MRLQNLLVLCLGASITALSGCSVAKNYTDAEKEMVTTMTPSKYQPATRQMRTNIETQDKLAQAAFWSREYQLNPADLEAAVKLASAVRKMGNASKAVEITQTSRAMYPNDPYLIAEHSAALIAMERGAEALKPLSQALHTAPGYARLWSLKGAALDQMSKYTEARKHYTRALQITPHDPNIMANMGLSYALAGDPRTAEQWLRRAAGHPDASSGIRQNLDLVLQLQGKPAHFAGMAKKPVPAGQSMPRRSAPNPAHNSGQPMGSYRPQSPMAAPQSRMVQPGMAPQHGQFGHRSNIAVTGNQPGGPKTAAEMARMAASKSPQSQSRVVIPHQPQAHTQAHTQAQGGNILDQISRSVNQNRGAAQPPVQRLPQGQPQAQPQPGPYGYPQQQPGQMAPQSGPPSHMNYEGVPSRRGAKRRR